MHGMSTLRWRMLMHTSGGYRRLLAVVLAIMGPRRTYAAMAGGAQALYRLLDPVRARYEDQCRAALAGRFSPAAIRRLAAASFIHRAWNLADLMLAERLVRPTTYPRFGGRIASPHRDMLLEAQRRGQPVILVTAYYGPYDLLPLFLGYNGIKAVAVYRPHANAAFDAYRRSVRTRSGCELVTVAEAALRLPQVLAAGGAAAILADHYVARRGIPVSFLGLETTASKAVGMLAVQYGAIVAVAAIRRRREPFRFDLLIADWFGPTVWAGQDDAVALITRRYTAALERVILEAPAQYLWAHARWGEGGAADGSGAADLPGATRACR